MPMRWARWHCAWLSNSPQSTSAPRLNPKPLPLYVCVSSLVRIGNPFRRRERGASIHDTQACELLIRTHKNTELCCVTVAVRPSDQTPDMGQLCHRSGGKDVANCIYDLEVRNYCLSSFNRPIQTYAGAGSREVATCAGWTRTPVRLLLELDGPSSCLPFRLLSSVSSCTFLAGETKMSPNRAGSTGSKRRTYVSC
jgi:hypothetical protein